MGKMIQIERRGKKKGGVGNIKLYRQRDAEKETMISETT